MKTEIAKNDKYSLSIDAEKNRIYWAVYGYWESPEVVPDFFDDWEKSVELCSEGFTIMADLTTMTEHPPDVVINVHQKVQKWLLEKGCIRIAQINKNVKIAALVKQMLREVGMSDIIKAFPPGASRMAAKFLDEA